MSPVMSATDEAYERIRDDIMSWKLPPGSPIAEIETAERLGVSRTPLRAALARLAHDGLVITERGRTAVVSDVSAAKVRNLFELRHALETHAARLAAERADAAVFAELAERFARQAATVSDQAGADDLFDATRVFEEAIEESLANPSYAVPLRNIRLHLGRARLTVRNDYTRLRSSAAEHLAICEAIVARDPEAAVAATVAHLSAALVAILEAIEADPTHQNA